MPARAGRAAACDGRPAPGLQEATLTRKAPPLVFVLEVTAYPGTLVNPTSYGLPDPRCATTVSKDTVELSVDWNAGRLSVLSYRTEHCLKVTPDAFQSHQP